MAAAIPPAILLFICAPSCQYEQGRIEIVLSSYLHHLSEQQTAALLGHYGEAVAARRRRALLLALAVAVCTVLAAWGGEVDLKKFVEGLPRFWSYFYDIVPKLRLSHLSADFAEWFWNWDGWLRLLAETLLVAYVGTFLGASIGFALCFFASANLVANAVVRGVVRRSLEFCRTVPEIVFALLFVYALGLGPIPGVLAIAFHTVGALGKQFSEVVENVDMKTVDGVRATGSTWVEQIRFAVLPQVSSNLRKLHAAALRNKRAGSLGDGLCWCRGYRQGTAEFDPAVLLFRRQCNPSDDHRDRVRH